MLKGVRATPSLILFSRVQRPRNCKNILCGRECTVPLPDGRTTSGGAAEAAADRKTSKYSQLAQTYIFVPIAIVTFGPINKAGFQFLSEFGKRISQESGDHRESTFIFQ